MINQYNSTNDELLKASTGRHFQRRADFMLSYLSIRKIKHPILDIGKQSPMTIVLQDRFGQIDNTDGDLDCLNFITPKRHYKTVLYLHTIEHQFNPLLTLLRIKEIIDTESQVFIAMPSRPKIFFSVNHYHEMGERAFYSLCQRAGFQIVTRALHRHKKEWQNLFKVRPFIRYFLDKEAVYELRVKP